MEKSNKKLGLTTKIFIALILGAICGVVLYYWVPNGTFRDDVLINGVFYVVGDGFLRLMQMLVVPLVFCSLVCGSAAIGDTKTLGKVGMKTVTFYMLTTALAITVALSVGKIINPGIGLDISSVQQAETQVAEATSIADTLLNIIPKNPIQGLAEGNMLQIILLKGFTQFNDLMMEMTSLIMNVAPFGVFCLIAKNFANIGFDAFLPMLKYMLSVFIALGVQCFVVYMLFLKVTTGLSPVKFIKKFAPVMGFAFSTATSNATIPMSIDTLYKKMGVSKKISSFTIPLGATATLASIGTAGVPSVGLITLSMVFTSVGLPVEGIALIMGIDRILDMTRTAVNITGDAICTTIVAYQNKDVDIEVFNEEKEAVEIDGSEVII